MKNLVSKILMVGALILSPSLPAQIKNAKTEVVKVYGSCGMCKTKIEKAGNIKNTVLVVWNQETQKATLTYDTTKTTTDEILKRIALVGYDSDQFLAPDEVYNNLHGCCQYERVAKMTAQGQSTLISGNHEHSNAETPSEATSPSSSTTYELHSVLDHYFLVKDVLTTSNGNATATASKALVNAIKNVKMDKLDTATHKIWMNVVNSIQEDAEHIAETNDSNRQRQHFMTLSINMYTLMKVAEYETPVYYQFCPMFNDSKGAYWLSKDSTIKNPYYGAMMLSCGKTVETIK